MKLRNRIRNFKNVILNVDTQTPFDKIKNNDTILVSFPKAGRTWVRLMLEQLDVNIEFTHDGSGHVRRIPFNKLFKNKAAYNNIKVVLLVRDPRDMVVSGFFHSTKRKKVFKGTISEFIRDKRHGIRKIVQFYINWFNALQYLENILLISYEDLQENTFLELTKILEFLNIVGVNKNKIYEIIEFSKFDNMQKLEKQGFFKDTFGEGLTPGNKYDIDSYKTRKGKIGGFTDSLSISDIEYCNTILTKYKYPFPFLK